jgi:hypothetical protein
MNPENLTDTSIYVHKFGTEQNNMAYIIKLLKAYNELWKSEIYTCSQVQY